MHDFERQVEELSSRVSALMREKANLESRNSLLERVVQLKDATEASPPQVSHGPLQQTLFDVLLLTFALAAASDADHAINPHIGDCPGDHLFLDVQSAGNAA